MKTKTEELIEAAKNFADAVMRFRQADVAYTKELSAAVPNNLQETLEWMENEANRQAAAYRMKEAECNLICSVLVLREEEDSAKLLEVVAR